MVMVRMLTKVGAMEAGTLQDTPADLARVLIGDRKAVLDAEKYQTGCVGLERAAVDLDAVAERRESDGWTYRDF